MINIKPVFEIRYLTSYPMVISIAIKPTLCESFLTFIVDALFSAARVLKLHTINMWT